jgi:glycosyltransferase involved in cell wall biosynthesis
MLKILQVNHFFLDGGGRERYILELSKGLAKRGHEVTILTSDYTPTGKEPLGEEARNTKGIFLKTLKGYLVDVPPGRVVIPDLMNWLLKNDKYDVIHAHGMGEQVVLEAFYIAKIKNIPFVFTPHFHPYFAYQELGAQKIWKVLQETQTKMIVENADATIAFSNLDKKIILKYTKASPRSKIFIVPNGVDENLPKVKQKDIKEVFAKYNIPKATHYLIFLGDITNPRKGALLAIQIFREIRYKLPDSHLIVVGPWGTRLKTAQSLEVLMRLLNKLVKAGAVTITGWVNDKEKAALLSGSDLLISPTLYDSFGVALAEAMFYKTPVVATKIGGIPHTVRDGIDGILVKNPYNIKAFARACLKILTDKKLKEKLGKNASKRVKRLFLFKYAVQKMEKIYKILKLKYASRKD